MRSRTIIIVSHHVQLCGPDAAHIVALDNGHVEFSGLWNDFQGSKTIQSIVLSNPAETLTDEVLMVEDTDNGDLVKGPDENVSNDGDSNPDTVVLKEPKQAREETRFEGHISKDVWLLYIRSAGNIVYWIAFSVALGLASLSPVWESGWLRCVRQYPKLQCLTPDPESGQTQRVRRRERCSMLVFTLRLVLFALVRRFTLLIIENRLCF